MDEGTRRQLVVVEDDLIVRVLLTTRLRTAGYLVEAAQDGRAGLGLIRQLQPDLVLSDWMMPGMDGPQLIARMRAEDAMRRIYVILLTGKHDGADRAMGLRTGADDYLVKPWSDADLLARVRSGLRIRAYPQETAVA